MRLLCILLLLSVSPVIFAQPYTSRLGRFRMDEIKGCAPLTVTILDANLITVGQCDAGDPCDMTWGDGSPVVQNVFTHTYTQPGTYTLRILYQTIGSDDIQITVTPNTPPTFDIFTCGNREVEVQVTDTNYDSYIINFNDGSPEVAVPKGMLAVANHTYAAVGIENISVRGKDANADDNCTPPATKSVDVVNALTPPFINLLTVASSSQIDLAFPTSDPNVLYQVEIALNTPNPASFQPVKSVHDVISTSVTNLRTDDNYYCFRLGAVDPCNNIIAYSNIICSSNFDLALQNNANNLTWTSSTTGVTSFFINRDGTNIGSTLGSSFSDNNVNCGINYCYQLLSNYSNGSQSLSLQKCGIAFSTNTPTATNNVTAVVNTNGVDLIWQQDAAFQAAEYSVFRRPGSENFGLLSTTTEQSYTDNGYTTEGDFCYRINYKDVCNNSSAIGIDVCPIQLSVDIDSDNIITLTWSDYTGWANGVNSYVVEKYDAQGAPLQTFNVVGASSFEDTAPDPTNQTFIYVVRANANTAGLGQAVSNEVTAIKKLIVNYPTAFTPNGDNVNDTYQPEVPTQHDYLSTFEMKIYNRWGELLFTTTDIFKGWDGRYKGKEQPEGTYVYVTTITDFAGRTLKHSSSVVLLNKSK